jgi:ankyrin repeat protein
MTLKVCRKLSTVQGVVHLRAQEAAKSASDITVLNERLWSAAELGDEQTIRTLISVGAEVNSQPTLTTPELEDQKPLLQEPLLGPSALHLAAGNGKSNAVCALVELGADVTTRDADLSTPLHRAVVGGHLGEQRPLVALDRINVPPCIPNQSILRPYLLLIIPASTS